MKIAKKLLGGAARAVPGLGTALTVYDTVSGVFGGNKKQRPKPGEPGYKVRRRGITYYLRKIPVEKAKARLQKIKMSAYKGL